MYLKHSIFNPLKMSLSIVMLILSIVIVFHEFYLCKRWKNYLKHYKKFNKKYFMYVNYNIYFRNAKVYTLIKKLRLYSYQHKIGSTFDDI